MGVIPLHEAIVKITSKPNPVNLSSNANSLAAAGSASPPNDSLMNFLTSTASNSSQCEMRTSLPNIMSSRTIVSGLTQSSASTTQLSTSSKPTPSSPSLTAGSLSQTGIRRNCSYTSISRSFPYYIPVPSSAKLKGKPKKYQSFVQSTSEQEQSVLSPSGSEGSSRDSGFNSDASSPIPPIVSSEIDQLLDEIASLDDIN